MKRLGILLIILISATAVHAAETAYVSDQIMVWTRTGPTTEYRVKFQLTPGSKLEVLQTNEETGFMEIRDEAGREAWIETSLVSSRPTANVLLVEARRDAQTKSEAHKQEVERLSRRLRELEPMQNTNKDLQEKLALAESQLEQAQQKAQLYESGFDRDAYFTGAVIVLSGMFLGWLLSRVGGGKRSSGWSS